MRNHFIKELIEKTGNTHHFLDCKKKLWKLNDGIMIGKRSVWTKDKRCVWLQDTTIENVKTWWCGRESDYNEIFHLLNN